LLDVPQWHQEGTFRLAEEGGRPIIALEVVSPSTRGHDLYNKPDLYYRVGIHKYILIDRGPRGEDAPRLLGFQRDSGVWVRLAPDAQGRLDLSPVGIQLGLEGNRPWMYVTATGERLPDLTEAVQGKRDAEARAQAEAEARAEEARARAEAQTCAKVEAKARSDAETRAKDAETRAKDAETRAKDEAERRAALEERLRQLEEQFRQKG
jgi:hypothetical protein